MKKPSSTYQDFLAFGERCRKVWADFKQSFHDPRLKTYLKCATAVLSCASGQIPLDDLEANSIAIVSPASFTSNRASKSLIEHVRLLENLKKEAETQSKVERKRIEKWLREFNRNKLEFEKHQLEIRFQSLDMECIRTIKRSSYVDHEMTDMRMVSIRIVLKVPVAP